MSYKVFALEETRCSEERQVTVHRHKYIIMVFSNSFQGFKFMGISGTFNKKDLNWELKH